MNGFMIKYCRLIAIQELSRFLKDFMRFFLLIEYDMSLSVCHYQYVIISSPKGLTSIYIRYYVR